MYCVNCGANVQPEQRFCATCGKPTGATPAPPPAAPPLGRVARHARTVGILWIAFAALSLLRGGSRILGSHFIRMSGYWYNDTPWGAPLHHLIPAALSFFGMVSLILACAGFAVGWGLL